MVIEYIRYAIPEERKQAFLDGYAAAAASLEASPHCLAYELSQGEEEPHNFILRIEWDSTEGHLNGFRKSSGFQQFFMAVRPFYNDIQEMKHYQVTSVQWRRG